MIFFNRDQTTIRKRNNFSNLGYACIFYEEVQRKVKKERKKRTEAQINRSKQHKATKTKLTNNTSTNVE